MRDFFLGPGFGLPVPPTDSGYTSVATDALTEVTGGDAAWVATDAVPWGELAATPASASPVPWSRLVGLTGWAMGAIPACSPAMWSLMILEQ
jgi:hypothetical protein